MTVTDLKSLAVQSLRDPASVARYLIALDLRRDVLWTGLLLMAVLQTLVFYLSEILHPSGSDISRMIGSPLVFFALAAVVLGISVYSIFWAGRFMQGQGKIEDVLVVLTWLQALMVAVQATAMVLVMAVPMLAAMLLLAANFASLYILLHFINQAHQLHSIGRSIGVLVVALIVSILGLSVVLSLLGVLLLGGPSNLV